MIRQLIRPMIRPMIRPILDGSTFIDPVPDYVLKYKMDGNDVALTLVNSPPIIAGLDLPDKRAMNFNGIDQRAESSETSLINVGAGAFSLVMRIKTTSTNNQVLFGTGSGGDPERFRFRINNLGKTQFRINNTNKNGVAVVNTGNWVHLAISCDGAGLSIRFYVDGTLDATYTHDALSNIDGTGDLVVGALDGGGQPITGDIDDARWYARAITLTEIQTLNNNI